MFKKRIRQSINSVIHEESMKSKKIKDAPYDGDIFVINGERYVPINFYTNEYGIIEASFIEYSKRHLIDLYVKIKAMQYGRKEHLPVPQEFLE